MPSFRNYELVLLSGNLYLIGATVTNLSASSEPTTIQTWRSADHGVTWTNLGIVPASSLRHFALAGDGTTAFLTGGRDATSNQNTNQVWKFNGSAWTQVSVVTSFDNNLYVIGGYHGANVAEVWRPAGGIGFLSNGLGMVRTSDLPSPQPQGQPEFL